MYCAPEILDGNRYNTGVDVYSFAITVFECVCGRDNVIQQFRGEPRFAVCSGWRPQPTTALQEHHPHVWGLIQECWRSQKTEVKGVFAPELAADIAKRPTFTEIVQRLESMTNLQSHVAQRQSKNPSQDLIAALEAARTSRRNSPKEFAWYLSYNKQACAPEARLVKQQLESMLDAKVFLGK